MMRCTLWIPMVIASLALSAAGCRGKAEGKAQLPPAIGAGAPPLPELPKIESAPPPRAAGGAAPVATSDARATGTLYPHAEAALAPQASGIIAEVLVGEGDRVKKGDVVFRLDSGDAALRRQQAAAGLDAARVNLKAVKLEYDRTKALYEENAVNRAQWDAVEARHDAALVGVRQAEVALAMAMKALADTSVRTPIDGVVTAKLKNTGEMATMMPPTIVVVVQDQATLELRVRLPERSLMQVKPGDTLTASFEALGVKRSARVLRINPTVDMRSRTIEVVAELPNPDLALKAGLLAQVELGTPPDDGARR
jgi:RND family efflux transporter MFP subunit